MKTNEFVKDLNTKSAAELNDELVAAKGTLQFKIPECNQPA